MLRIHLAGHWTCEEFGAFFSGIQALADYFETGQVRGELVTSPTPGSFKVSAAEGGLPIEVRRVEYSSPGFTDLAGVAKSLEQIRLLVQYLIDVWIHRTDRELDREEKRLALFERRVQLLEKASFKENPEFSKPIEAGVADPILEAISDRRITRVELLDY